MPAVATALVTLAVLGTAELVRQIPSVIASKKLKEDIKEQKKLKKEGMGTAERQKLAGETNALQAAHNKALINTFKDAATDSASLVDLERMALEQAEKSKEATGRIVATENARVQQQAAVDLATLKGTELALEHQRNQGLADLGGDVLQVAGTSVANTNESGDRSLDGFIKGLGTINNKSAYGSMYGQQQTIGGSAFTPDEEIMIQSLMNSGNTRAQAVAQIDQFKQAN
jgi:hypothetical protein|tara:strand:+ start:1327 stop:2013 length:687 start_codon:yes stop_codon:yes gene_type:complete